MAGVLMVEAEAEEDEENNEKDNPVVHIPPSLNQLCVPHKWQPISLDCLFAKTAKESLCARRASLSLYSKIEIICPLPLQLSGLALRVSVEGFFVVARNNTDFNCDLYWYFTSVELRQYMPLAVRKRWDTADVGVRLEAFVVAGCDTMNLLRTAPQKAAHAKGEIQDKIGEMLVEITGDPKAKMAYVHYEEDVVHNDLTTSLPVLRTLLNAIKSGTCKFVRLTPIKLKARKVQYEADIAEGKITGKQHNPRSDIGRKRKRVDEEEEEGDDELEDQAPLPLAT
ncbi:hypothetical protein B0H13DRAFT_2352073 [Mycena leptocephala]|nr:hypothetical protein B0H13DRAFT_2352073 [Mycena leptocephala]